MAEHGDACQVVHICMSVPLFPPAFLHNCLANRLDNVSFTLTEGRAAWIYSFLWILSVALYYTIPQPSV